MRRSRTLSLTAAALILTAGAVVLSGAAQPAKAPPRSADATTLTADMAIAAVTAFDIQTTATGELEARNQIELRSRLERSSTIIDIIAEGARVKEGEVLVRLNSDEIQTQIDEEVMKVEAARADVVNAENAYDIQLSENESKLRQAKLKLDLAELGLKEWREGEVISKREANRLEVQRTELEFRRLKEKVERSETLLANGFASKDEVEQDRSSLVRAEAEMIKARLASQVYDSYQHPKDEKTKLSDVEEARAELTRVEKTNESQLASKGAVRTNMRNQLASRDSKLAKLNQQLDAATVRAPQDGLVVYTTSTERGRGGWGNNTTTLQIGTSVQPNQSMILLPDTTEMRASVRVHESLAGRIRPGMHASVRVEAAGKTYQGRVESIGVLAETGGWRDPNLREYTVKIAVTTDPADGLKPSMQCESVITLGRVESALSVPVQAVFMDGPVRFVYTQQRGKYVRTPVRIGRRSDTLAEITKGVAPGTPVLLREPAPGEVLNQPWTAEILDLAGYKLDEKGQPIDPLAIRAAPPAAMPNGVPGAGPNGQAPNGQGPNGQAPLPGRQRTEGDRPRRKQEPSDKPANPPA